MKLVLISLLLCELLGARVLSLKSAVNQTLNSHPDIRAYTLKVKGQELYKNIVSANRLPQISAQLSYNINRTFTSPSLKGLKITNKNASAYSIKLRQLLYDFGKTNALIKEALISKDIARLSLKKLKKLLAYRVKILYYTAALQQRAIAVKRENLRLKELYYKRAVALFKQGLKSKIDSERFFTEVQRAKADLIEAKAAFKKAKESLGLLMGAKLGKSVAFNSGVLKHFTNLNATNAAKNIDVAIQKRKIAKSYQEYKAKKAHFGDIEFQATYSHINGLNSYNSKDVAVVANIPIYSGGKLSNEEQLAKLNYQIAKLERASKTLEVKDELNGIKSDIIALNGTIKMLKSELKYSRDLKNAVNARYKNGLSSYLEVLDSINLIYATKLELLQSYYKRALLIAKLEYLQ